MALIIKIWTECGDNPAAQEIGWLGWLVKLKRYFITLFFCVIVGKKENRGGI